MSPETDADGRPDGRNVQLVHSCRSFARRSIPRTTSRFLPSFLPSGCFCSLPPPSFAFPSLPLPFLPFSFELSSVRPSVLSPSVPPLSSCLLCPSVNQFLSRQATAQPVRQRQGRQLTFPPSLRPSTSAADSFISSVLQQRASGRKGNERTNERTDEPSCSGPVTHWMADWSVEAIGCMDSERAELVVGRSIGDSF